MENHLERRWQAHQEKWWRATKKDGEKPPRKMVKSHQVEKKKEVNGMEKSTEELVDILITISVISRMIAKKLMMEGEDTNEKRRCSRCSD